MCTYLSRRGATYYFRRVIPEDLRPAFDDRAEFIWSLATKDRNEGKRRAQQATVETNKRLEDARARIIAGEPPASDPVADKPRRRKRPLSPQEREDQRQLREMMERSQYSNMLANERDAVRRENEEQYSRYNERQQLAEAKQAGREEVEAENRLARQ